MCGKYTHISQTVGGVGKKVENNVIRAWTEAGRAGGKKKVNMTNNWREVQPQAVLLN